MNLPETHSDLPLFTRRAGDAGPTVVCLHSSTATNGQWRALVTALAIRTQVVAPDFHGHGRSPAWPDGRAPSLQIDAQAVQALLPAEGDLHVVAHSYGAAVAMQVVMNLRRTQPGRVRSLSMYEPVAFGVLHALAPSSPALAEITDIAERVARLCGEQDYAEAAREFLCYWGGPDAWTVLTEEQRAAAAERIRAIPLHFASLFASRWTAQELQQLDIPVLLLHGARTRASARGVADLLGAHLPHVQRMEIAGAGHIGCMTHEAQVNAAILAHLSAHGA